MVAQTMRYALVLLAVLACSGSSEPGLDCASAVGTHFVVLAGDADGDMSINVKLGDSTRLYAQVREVTEATRRTEGGYYTYCDPVSWISVVAVVTYATTTPDVLDVKPDGRVRALAQGLGLVTVTSSSPEAYGTIGVSVTLYPTDYLRAR